MSRVCLVIPAMCQLLAGADNLTESNRSTFSAAFLEGRLSPSFQNGRLVSVALESAVSRDNNG